MNTIPFSTATDSKSCYIQQGNQEMSAMGFNANEHIEMLDDGFALCTNPSADGGMSAITVNTNLHGEALKNFEQSIKRMVLGKLFSPKFGEIILTATRMRLAEQQA